VGSPAPARASQIPAQKASVKPVGRRPREPRTSASRSARGRSARKSGLFGTLRPERRWRGTFGISAKFATLALRHLLNLH